MRLSAAGYEPTFWYFDYNAFVEDLTTEFRQVSPNPTTYINGIDFRIMSYSGSGNPTAPLARPANLGCDAADWGGFPAGSVAIVSGSESIFLPLSGLIDVDAERARIVRDIEQVGAEIDRAKTMLSNEQFVSRAPEAVVEGHRAKLAAAEERLALLQARLADLG